MKFGLKNRDLKRIHEILSTHPEVEEVVIYGSRAKGTYKNGSDIDLTLKGSSLTPKILSQIQWEIEDLLLPYMCDLSIFLDIESSELIEHIERVGKVFFRAESHQSGSTNTKNSQG